MASRFKTKCKRDGLALLKQLDAHITKLLDDEAADAIEAAITAFVTRGLQSHSPSAFSDMADQIELYGTTPAWPTDTLKGAERHVYLFDHPAYVMLRAALNGGVVVCDLCEFSDPLSLGPEKATAFLASQNAFADVQRMFADKRCTHGKAAHGAAMRGAASAGGGYATAGSEHYSRVLCEALAACLWPAGAGGAASV